MPTLFRREAAATQALAERMPDLVPEVIAVDEPQGWMLMRDLGAAELGDQDESLWHEGLVAHAGIQRSWLGRTDELVGLGLPVRSLTDLAAQVEEMSEDTVLLERMSAELRERWLATAPTLVESCRRLDEIGPGPTLVHGDLHPWNVVFGAGAHARLRLDRRRRVAPVRRSRHLRLQDPGRLRAPAPGRCLCRCLVDGGSEESLREAAALGLVVGALYQVQTYRALLPTLMGNGADDDLAGADLDWINRALTRHRAWVWRARPDLAAGVGAGARSVASLSPRRSRLVSVIRSGRT